MSSEYKAQAQIASVGVYMQVTVQITGLPDNGSVSFKGNAGGIALPGGGGAWGTLFTDDIGRLTRDTVSFQFNAALGVYFNVNFFDGNSQLLGHFQGGGIGTVTGTGGGTGTWDHVVTPAIVGVGMDRNLYLRTTLNDPWKQVANSGSVTGVAVMTKGEIAGIGMNRQLYKRATLNSPPWQALSGGGEFLAITAMGDGLLGVGMDNCLYTIAIVDGAARFNKVPNSGSVTGVAVTTKGEVVGIGMNRQLYMRATLNSAAWQALSGGGEFLAITAMGDGLLGVGMDNFLYTIAIVDGVARFNKVPNSGSVTAIACYP